jgi:hypothetical protein
LVRSMVTEISLEPSATETAVTPATLAKVSLAVDACLAVRAFEATSVMSVV